MILFFVIVYALCGAVCAFAETTEIGRGATWLGVFLAFVAWPLYVLCALWEIRGRDE